MTCGAIFLAQFFWRSRQAGASTGDQLAYATRNHKANPGTAFHSYTFNFGAVFWN